LYPAQLRPSSNYLRLIIANFAETAIILVEDKHRTGPRLSLSRKYEKILPRYLRKIILGIKSININNPGVNEKKICQIYYQPGGAETRRKKKLQYPPKLP
jgi:hypothetical protein